MKHLLIILVALILIPGRICAQTAQEKDILTTLDRYYEKCVKEWDIPGMSVAIVKDGKVTFSKG